MDLLAYLYVFGFLALFKNLLDYGYVFLLGTSLSRFIFDG